MKNNKGVTLISLITALTVAAQLLQSPEAMAGLAVLAASISTILLVIAATLPTILDACSDFINNVGPFLIKLIESINNGISTVIYALGTTLPPIINSVGNIFTKIFTGIENIIKSVGNVIVKIMNTAKSLVDTVLSAIIKFIKELGPAINSFIDNAIKGVTKLVNFMISAIEYLVNTLIIKGVNKIIKAINSCDRIYKSTRERYILELQKSESEGIREVAQYVYENIFLKYTMKQWEQKPEEVDQSVTARVPVLISYDNRYFQDTYQGMPEAGYTVLFENLLNHENIKIELGVDAKDVLTFDFKNHKIFVDGKEFNGPIVFTGAIDELFDYIPKKERMQLNILPGDDLRKDGMGEHVARQIRSQLDDSGSTNKFIEILKNQ